MMRISRVTTAMDGAWLAEWIGARERNPYRWVRGLLKSELEYLDEATGSNDDIRSTQLSGYLGQDIGRFFLQGAAGYAWQEYDGTRDTGATGVATASNKGHQWGARVTLGVPLELSSAVSFTPQVRANWANVKQDAYNETGGGVFGLSVAAKSVDRFRGSLGGQLDFDTQMGGLRPAVPARILEPRSRRSGEGYVGNFPRRRNKLYHSWTETGPQPCFVGSRCRLLHPGGVLRRSELRLDVRQLEPVFRVSGQGTLEFRETLTVSAASPRRWRSRFHENAEERPLNSKILLWKSK